MEKIKRSITALIFDLEVYKNSLAKLPAQQCESYISALKQAVDTQEITEQDLEQINEILLKVKHNLVQHKKEDNFEIFEKADLIVLINSVIAQIKNAK